MKPLRRAARLSKTFVWHGKHEWTHLLLGYFWVHVLGIIDPLIPSKYLALSLFASLLPDIEHLLYHLLFQRRNTFSRQVISYLRQGKITDLFRMLEENHKTVSFLPLHHIVIVGIMLIVVAFSLWHDREGSLVFFGAVAIHYVFDMVDDILILGKLNPNWTRGIQRFKRFQRRIRS